MLGSYNNFHSAVRHDEFLPQHVQAFKHDHSIREYQSTALERFESHDPTELTGAELYSHVISDPEAVTARLVTHLQRPRLAVGNDGISLKSLTVGPFAGQFAGREAGAENRSVRDHRVSRRVHEYNLRLFSESVKAKSTSPIRFSQGAS